MSSVSIPQRPINNGAARYLRPKDAAAYTGLTARTLENLRRSGGGPAFVRLSRRLVVYDVADLDAFMASRKVANTAQGHALAEGGVL